MAWQVIAVTHNHCMSAAFRAWMAYARDCRKSSDMFARAVHFFRSTSLLTAFAHWHAYAHEHAQARRKLALAIACFQHSLLVFTWRAWRQVDYPGSCYPCTGLSTCSSNGR